MSILILPLRYCVVRRPAAGSLINGKKLGFTKLGFHIEDVPYARDQKPLLGLARLSTRFPAGMIGKRSVEQ